MSEKIALSGVPETMLQTVYARARETQTRGAIRDEKAVELVRRLDYDFHHAEADTVMRSGVVARTIVLDRLTQVMGNTQRQGQRWYMQGPAGMFWRVFKQPSASSETTSVNR